MEDDRLAARPTLEQLHAALHERVADAAARHNVPGVTVGVLLDGAEDYVCHGVTSVPNPLPIDEGTLFAIGSTTKVYTATAIMVLVERGLLDLAAPVRRYLPELELQDEYVAANVTVLNLLNHTAGWAGDVFTDTGYGDDALARYVALIADVPQETPLGAYVSYNNAAVSVAGRVIEAVTGQVYEAAVRDLVLDPLGLTEHFFFPWEVMLHRFAVGHILDDDTLQVAPWHEPRATHPAGGEFAASVRDQLRFARFHLGDPSASSGQAPAGVLRPETLAQMRTPTTPVSKGGHWDAVGVSWLLREIDGVWIVAHGGSGAGYHTALELVPERNFALSVLTNAAHSSPLIDELTRWVFETYLGIAEQIPEPLPLTADELAEYAGAYAAHNGVLEISVEGDWLSARFAPDPAVLEELRASGGEFTPPPPFPIQILPGGQFLVLDGPAQGVRGPWLRDTEGRVTALNFGGRVMLRRETTS